jgi:hypothetical protein
MRLRAVSKSFDVQESKYRSTTSDGVAIQGSFLERIGSRFRLGTDVRLHHGRASTIHSRASASGLPALFYRSLPTRTQRLAAGLLQATSLSFLPSTRRCRELLSVPLLRLAALTLQEQPRDVLEATR